MDKFSHARSSLEDVDGQDRDITKEHLDKFELDDGYEQEVHKFKRTGYEWG